MKKLFYLRDINKWVFAAGAVSNLLWVFLIFLVTYLGVIGSAGAMNSLFQVGLLLMAFLGPFLIGWVQGWMAADGRGPTYGLVSTVGGLLLAAFVLLPTGLVGLMVIIANAAGGLNGGLFAERRRIKR